LSARSPAAGDGVPGKSPVDVDPPISAGIIKVKVVQGGGDQAVGIGKDSSRDVRLDVDDDAALEDLDVEGLAGEEHRISVGDLVVSPSL